MNRVEVVKWFKDPILLQKLYILAKKANFARVRSARGWGLAYQASSIDLTHQSHTLDPALKACGARRAATIQLLLNDKKHSKASLSIQKAYKAYQKRIIIVKSVLKASQSVQKCSKVYKSLHKCSIAF